MPTPLSGPGVGLPLPQNLYPSALQNAPIDFSNNRQALAPGDALPLPAGDWYVNVGMYCVLQFLDPVTGVWATGNNAAWAGGIQFVKSDGFSCRVANLTGCIVGASITSYGNGSYVQASTTISVTGASGVTIQPIIGGQLNIATTTIVTANAGAGYGVAPLVFIPAPPPATNNANGVGGVPATAYATIANGTVSGVSFTNPGAGYPTPPIAVILPNPTDPNINVGITAATVTFSITGAGSLTGALVTNNGKPLSNGSLGSVTLTVNGAGATASVAAVVMQTVVSGTVSGTGVGYGTTVGLVTTGGVPNAGTITNNPDFLNLAWRPRPANIGFGSATAGAVATIYDGGLFEGTPNFILVGGAASTVGTVAMIMGSANDFVTLQPAP